MKIINIDDVKKSAFELGFDRFDGMDPVPREEFDLSYFTETAEYANTTAPTLRRLSGHADGGRGTYTERRDVLVINQGDADELAADAGWIDADMVWCSDLFETVHESWREGVYEAADRARDCRTPAK